MIIAPVKDLLLNKAVLNKDYNKLDVSRKVMRIHRGHGHLKSHEISIVYFMITGRKLQKSRVEEIVRFNCKYQKLEYLNHSYRKPAHVANYPGDLTVADMYGPIHSVYVVTVTDVKSQYTFHRHIANRNQFTKKVIEMPKLMINIRDEFGDAFNHVMMLHYNYTTS